MSWKNIITAFSFQALQKRGLPIVVKELAWRLIYFVIRCGSSHPFSFILRPITSHKHFRTGVGITLALIVSFLAFYGPLPSFAGDSIGGPVEVNINPEGAVNLATLPSVQLPIAGYRFTQGFNWYHRGIDLAAPRGTPVRPVMSGQVTKVEYAKYGYGNNVQITHANGYQSLYAHLSKIEVTSGQNVELANEIGQVGSTGRSSGPHLHLEVQVNGAAVNPKSLLDVK